MAPLCGLGVSGVTLEGTGLPAAQGLLEPSFSLQDDPLTMEGRARAPWGPRAVS